MRLNHPFPVHDALQTSITPSKNIAALVLVGAKRPLHKPEAIRSTPGQEGVQDRLATEQPKKRYNQ
jgi:hypothetical protein